MGLIIVIKLSQAKDMFLKVGERYITIYRIYMIHT